MKKIMITDTTLCLLIFLLPPVILCAVGFILLGIGFEIIGIILLVIDLIYLIIIFPYLFSGEILLSIIEEWKKDRLWYALTQSNDEIIARARRHGKPFASFEASQAPLLVQNKKQHSLTIFWSDIIKTVIVYKTENLDDLTYRKIFASARQLQSQTYSPHKHSIFMSKDENDAPVCHAISLIILADKVGEAVIKAVRDLPDFEESALVPCIVDNAQKRVYFDGLKDPVVSGMSGSTPKNLAIKMISKIVFGGKLPLKDNDQFDYSRIDNNLLEKTLLEFISELRNESKNSKAQSFKIAKIMVYDEIKLNQDTLYVKLGERVAEFSVLEDEDASNLGIISEDFWLYPKKQKISKKDKKELRERITNFYAGKTVEFF